MVTVRGHLYLAFRRDQGAGPLASVSSALCPSAGTVHCNDKKNVQNLGYNRVQQGNELCACARQVMDMLVEQTHAIRHEVRSNERAMRFTDTRLDEQQRGVSLKMVPLSLVMAGGKGKSYLLNLIDTPGALSTGGPTPLRSPLAEAQPYV